MKKLILALVSLAFLYSANVEAVPITFLTMLSGANENPPNGSPGTGFARVVYDSATHMMTVDAMFAGLTGNTTAAHIHCCNVPPTNSPVATQVPSFTNFPLGVTFGTMPPTTFDLTLAGSWNPTFITNNGGTPASAEAAFAAGLFGGRAYFNIHSSTFGGGEIRGILQLPEPTTIGLLAFGLGGLVLARKRRKA